MATKPMFTRCSTTVTHLFPTLCRPLNSVPVAATPRRRWNSWRSCRSASCRSTASGRRGDCSAPSSPGRRPRPARSTGPGPPEEGRNRESNTVEKRLTNTIPFWGLLENPFHSGGSVKPTLFQRVHEFFLGSDQLNEVLRN